MKQKFIRLSDIFIFLALLLTVLVYGVLIVCFPTTYGLNGAYYNNLEWKGSPFTTLIDTDISINALKSHRMNLPHQFSVEWIGYIEIQETETYTFFTNSENGSWVFIDGNLVVDNGGVHGLREAQGQIHLIKGLHKIRIRYFHTEGHAALQISRAKGKYPKTSLIADLLLPLNTNLTQFRLYQMGKVVFPFMIVLWIFVVIIWIGKNRVANNKRLAFIKSKRYSQQGWHRGLLVLLIVGVLIFTFIRATNLGLHQYVNPILHNKIISVVLSDLEYGLKGYIGYTKVFKILHGTHSSLNDPKNSYIVNNAIEEALDVDDVSTEGLHFNNNEVGSAIYYKLAFKIFGYNVESLFYIHFLLLAISVFIFLITFYNRAKLLHILLLFVCSHFIVVMLTPVIGDQLQVSNHRFTPVLAILPSFYLALLILRKSPSNVFVFLGAIIQTSILMLCLLRRTSVTYQLIFLISIAILVVIWYWKKEKRKLKVKYLFNKIQLWPLVIVVVAFLLVKSYIMTGLHHSYTIAHSYHPFWCASIVGLSAHPESKSKYNFPRGNDWACYNAVQRRAAEQGLSCDFNFDQTRYLMVNRLYEYNDTKTVLPFSYLFENFARDEFLKILKQDTEFVFMNYMYKIPLFFKVYFSSSGINNYFFGATIYLFKWYILAIIAIATLLSVKKYCMERSYLVYIGIFVLQFVFALLPSLFFLPFSHIIADSGLLFTLIIYLLFSVAFCFIAKCFCEGVAR